VNAFRDFARLAAFIVVGCTYFSLWRYSAPATAIVIAVYWWTSHHRPSRLSDPYRSMPIAPTTWLSPSHVAVSISILTAIFIVVTER
jgi:hypothetical protein